MKLLPYNFRWIPCVCRTLVLSAAAISPVAGASAQGAGYWHTSGNRILDENGRQVRISGANWYGFETANESPGGLEAQDYRTILATVKSEGFNTLRIPLSSQMIEAPLENPGISSLNGAGPINSDLKGLNAMRVLDRVVAYAGKLGLKVILDHHRSNSGKSAQENGLWYTAEYPESAWIADWTALARHYAGNPTVIGFDLHNEPHSVGTGGACWDCGGAGDWHLAAERAGNAVLHENPNLLLFVEGTDVYNGDYTWWGGNLEGVVKSPVVLSVPNHLVYSVHDYGPREATQTWFNASTTYTTLTSVWTKHWEFVSQQNIAPVWLGEFGTPNGAADLKSGAPGSQGQWFQSLIAFLRADSNLGWAYWAVNAQDTYALLDTAYTAPASEEKASMLASIRQSPGKKTSALAILESFRPSPNQVNLAWAFLAGSGVTLAASSFTTRSKTEVLSRSRSRISPPALASRLAAMDAMWRGAKPSKSLKTASAPVRVGVAPGPPLELKTGSASARHVSLNWLPSVTPEASYTLYMGTSRAGIHNVVATGLGPTSYLVTGLDSDTTYYFHVKAVARGISSPASNVATAFEAEPGLRLEEVEGSKRGPVATTDGQESLPV